MTSAGRCAVPPFRTQAAPDRAGAGPGYEGRGSAGEANRQMGLALSADEIDYLLAHFRAVGRDPTDVELTMFAQANSSTATQDLQRGWVIDGQAQRIPVRHGAQDPRTASAGTIVAYSDNAAIMQGRRAQRFYPRRGPIRGARRAHAHADEVRNPQPPDCDIAFPAPPRARAGDPRRGRHRARRATQGGLCGFSVSHLAIPDSCSRGEVRGQACAHRIGTGDHARGPIGAASFNNEFGRPNLAGYFRAFEARVAHGARLHKPIMIAGASATSTPCTRQGPAARGALLIQLGGRAC